MRQEMVVIGNEWNFGCCAERREFSIVRIFNEDKVVGIDTAGKLSLWPKEISELIPTEGRNSAQNKLGLAPGRFVPDQLKASLPDSREDTLRCASRVEARGYEDIRVDDNPFHSDFIHRKLAKVAGKILTELKPVHFGPQSAWGRSGTGQNAGPRATRVGFTPTDLPGIASPVYAPARSSTLLRIPRARSCCPNRYRPIAAAAKPPPGARISYLLQIKTASMTALIAPGMRSSCAIPLLPIQEIA